MIKEIVVFVEKIYKDEKKPVYHLLLDFPFKNSNESLFYELITRVKSEEKSMLEVKNITFEKGGKPREGHFYKLPEIFIENNNWSTESNDVEQLSNYIALTYDASDIYPRFNYSLNFNFFSQNLLSSNDDIRNINISVNEYVNNDCNKIDISVFDVGQGNWNEILFNESFGIVYDIGASSSKVFLDTYKRVTLAQNRNIKINSILDDGYTFKKILIISHWDIDHYNGILELNDDVIKSFSFCLVPNRLENETTKTAFKKLDSLTTVYPIEMNPKGRGNGATSVLTEIYNTNLLKIYKGTKCSDRNKRGLLLSLHYKQVDFIFPADHHYNQINNYVIPNCFFNELNIVTPHHGGHAGNDNLINFWNHCTDSIISTNGRYGHPFPHIVNRLNIHFTSVHRTDNSSHYYRNI